MVKSYDFRYENRYQFDSSQIRLDNSGPYGTVLQFKTARGRNILRSSLPTTNNPLVPTSVLQRLTDGNLAYPFRHHDVREFKWTLPSGSHVHRIVVLHEPGTQPNDVVVAISTDGISLDILFNNDHDNSLGLGIGSDPQFVANWDGSVTAISGATWDPVRQQHLVPLTTNGALVFDLNCESVGYLYVYTSGFVSADASDPSSNETRISEVELYNCVYSSEKPDFITKESIRLTRFNDITIQTVEVAGAFIRWNVIVGDKYMFYDGLDWIEKTEPHQTNTTDEIRAHIESLFILPTVYDVRFAAYFVSEIGEETASLLELTVDFENDAAIKADTTTVFGRVAQGVSGMPDTGLWVTIDLELGRDSATTAQVGSDSRIVFAAPNVLPPNKRKDPNGQPIPEDEFKVNSNGVFQREVIPNSIMTASKSRYIFSFWRRHPHNSKDFISILSLTREIPRQAKYDLGTIVS